MNKLKNIILAVSLLTIFLSFTSVDIKDDCKILKNNTFSYKTGGKKVLVVFKKDKYIEYHNKKKHFIKANIEWVSSCEYYLIIDEVTLPNFPVKTGTKMHIKIDKVRGKNIYYTSTLGGRSWEGKLTKSKKKL